MPRRAHGGWGGRVADAGITVVATAIGHGDGDCVIYLLLFRSFPCQKCSRTILQRCPGPLENLDKSTIIIRLSRSEFVQSDH